MIKLKNKLCSKELITNLVENSKKEKGVLSSKIFKAVLTGTLISLLSTPVFADTIRDQVTAQELQTKKINTNSADVTSKIFRGLESSGKVKSISFSEKSSYKKEIVNITAFTPDPSATMITDSIYETYVESIEKTEKKQLISNYISWLNNAKAKNEFLYIVKDKESRQIIDNINRSINEIESTDFDLDKGAIGELKNLIVDSGLNGLPDSQKIKALNKTELAYAIQIMGVCSIVYNENIFREVISTGITKKDGTKIYASKDEVLKSFILNHEIAHCTSGNSPFLINSNLSAAKELELVKSKSDYSSLSFNEKTVFNIFAANYLTYAPEFYADVVGISRTIKEKGLSNSEAINLINDIIDIRNSTSLNGDISHATGHLLEKTKDFYSRKGVLFGADLLDNDADAKISSMVSSFSKTPFMDAMRDFVIIASANHKKTIDIKNINIADKKLYMELDYSKISNVIQVSNKDINKFVNRSRSVLNKFAVSEDIKKISGVVKGIEIAIKNDLSAKKEFLSMEY